MSQRKHRKISKAFEYEEDYTTFKTIIENLGIPDQYNAKNLRKEFLTTVKYPVSLIPCHYKGVNNNKQNMKYKTLCDITFRKSNECQLEWAIKRTWKTISRLQNFIRKYSNEKIPKYYDHQVHLLICLLLNVETNQIKRKIEEENMKNLEQIFVTMCKIIVPEEVMIIIFRFIPKNKRVFEDIVLVCSNFYLLYLKTCEKISVYKQTIMEYPLIVIKHARIIIFDTKWVLRDEFLHFLKNIHSIRKLYLGWRPDSQEVKDEKFFKYIYILGKKFFNLYKIQVTSIRDIKLDRKFFPNVRKLSFSKYNYDSGSVNKKTIQFLHKIKHISFRSFYSNFVGVGIIPKFLYELKNLETFHFNSNNVINKYPFYVVQYLTGLKRLKFKDNAILIELSTFLEGYNKMTNIKELYIKIDLNSLKCNFLLYKERIITVLVKLNNQKNIRKVNFTIFSRFPEKLISGVWSDEKLLKTSLKRFILKNKQLNPPKLKYTFFFLT